MSEKQKTNANRLAARQQDRNIRDLQVPRCQHRQRKTYRYRTVPFSIRSIAGCVNQNCTDWFVYEADGRFRQRPRPSCVQMTQAGLVASRDRCTAPQLLEARFCRASILAVDNAREISCRSLRSRPQSSRRRRRMKFVGPVSGVHLRERWIASQYVVFSGGRCAPTILVRPAGQFASSRTSSRELGASSRCWTSAPPVAGPRFSISKG